MPDAIRDAISERDRILTSLDVEAAKAFIRKHGGHVPAGKIDWLRVLHLARIEVTTMPEALHWDSRIWLAQHDPRLVWQLPPTSPYLRAAMDLIFPHNLTEAFIAAQGVPDAS